MIKSIITTHATQTDKKHLKCLFESGQTQIKINRTIWVISKGTPSIKEYEVYKIVNDRGIGLIGNSLRQSKYKFIVTLS